MRAASRVKSLSELTSTKPSNRPECRKSIAAITRPMSLAFLPLVLENCWSATSPSIATFLAQPPSRTADQSP